jgi:hypothetical protein
MVLPSTMILVYSRRKVRPSANVDSLTERIDSRESLGASRWTSLPARWECRRVKQLHSAPARLSEWHHNQRILFGEN